MVVLVDTAFTVSTNVAAESQPALLVRCAVCVPAPLNVSPFHVYGNAEGHTLIAEFEVVGCVMIRFSVAVLSQPRLFSVE